MADALYRQGTRDEAELVELLSVTPGTLKKYLPSRRVRLAVPPGRHRHRRHLLHPLGDDTFVPRDGRTCHAQLPRDLLVREALLLHFQDFGLTLRQVGLRRRLRWMAGIHLCCREVILDSLLAHPDGLGDGPLAEALLAQLPDPPGPPLDDRPAVVPAGGGRRTSATI